MCCTKISGVDYISKRRNCNLIFCKGIWSLQNSFPAKSYTGATSITFGQETMFEDSADADWPPAKQF